MGKKEKMEEGYPNKSEILKTKAKESEQSNWKKQSKTYVLTNKTLKL